ncbi:MAG TPA: SDR family oxidoreductase [Acidimicrobiia bacterium]|jgi:NAD(P)-dependent dehydrogenase (short-subunit alcohol dehydrogenase family)|nr:SDR family oxidoreductase [Acidimicrobiia bacterium]
MKLEGKCVVVTGGASGIGAALARRFAAEHARGVVVADVQDAALRAVAQEIDGAAVRCDVTDEAQVRMLVDTAEERYGPIDLFCSNAGIVLPGGEDSSDRDWERSLGVNVMAHVYAARALVPRMIERGGGYLLHTASAAGLLTQIGSATYSVTKHAALAFAEWLAITYGEQGLTVSVLAPQAVNTAMTAGIPDGGVAGVDGMLEPEAVASAVVEGLDAESFLILPHPEVLEYFRRKAADYDRWIRGMQRLQGRYGRAF